MLRTWRVSRVKEREGIFLKREKNKNCIDDLGSIPTDGAMVVSASAGLAEGTNATCTAACHRRQRNPRHPSPPSPGDTQTDVLTALS